MHSMVRSITLCLSLIVISAVSRAESASTPPLLSELRHEIVTQLGTAEPGIRGSAATDFFRGIIEPKIKGLPFNICVMAPGGNTVYDQDPTQIGLNLYVSPEYQAYPSLQELGRRVEREESGQGEYSFLDQDHSVVVRKQAHWVTVRQGESAWKVVLIQNEEKEATPAESTKDSIDSLSSTDAALLELSRNKEAIAAIAGGNLIVLERLLTEFRTAHPECYSVQWCDHNLIVRCGVPAEQSLKNYRFDPNDSSGNRQFVDKVLSRNEALFDDPLLEGGTGRFHLCPVFDGQNYLGMLYTIHRQAP